MFWIITAIVTAATVILYQYCLKELSSQLSKWIITIALPVGSLGLYFLFGSVDMPDFPYEEHKEFYQAQKNKPVTELPIFKIMAQLEERIQTHPEDLEAYFHLATIFKKMKNFKKAKELLNGALENNPFQESIKLWGLFAEILVLENKGSMTKQAREIFQNIKKHDPDNTLADQYLSIQPK